MFPLRLVATGCLVALTIDCHAWAQASERVYYGSRAGMVVTVVGKSGIGTSSARINAKLTLDDAAEFCREYLQKDSKACAKEVLRTTKLKPTISADCDSRTWTDFGGNSYQLTRSVAASMENGFRDYDIVSVGSGELLDGSSASGYSTALGLLEALCPDFKASLARGEGEGSGLSPGAEDSLPEDQSKAAEAFEKLELVESHTFRKTIAECRDEFESNAMYAEEGYVIKEQRIDANSGVARQKLVSADGKLVIEAACENGLCTFSRFAASSVSN